MLEKHPDHKHKLSDLTAKKYDAKYKIAETALDNCIPINQIQ